MIDYTTRTIDCVSKTYRQCLGTALDGSGRCSSCGAEIGTEGSCLALIEINTIPEEPSVKTPAGGWDWWWICQL